MLFVLTTLEAMAVLFAVAVLLNLRGPRLNRFLPSRDSAHPDRSARRAAGGRRVHFYPVVTAVLVVGFAAAIVFRVWVVGRTGTTVFMTTILVSLAFMIFSITASATNPEYTGDPGPLRVTVVIPTYNEDRETLRAVLASISAQTVLPNTVILVEDGSDAENVCRDDFARWAATVPTITTHYRYIANAGKREAQAVAFRLAKATTDIYVTLDSDTVLDPRAVEQGLRPFSDPDVTSVAGLLMNQNGVGRRAALLPKIAGLSFTSAFTGGRAFHSRFRSVTVNCGGLALYRASVVHTYLEAYLTQRAFGRQARFGDDRMLTLYASYEGHTVYQESSIGYTLIPVTISHLTRQRLRWWKSYWWGFILLRTQSMRRGVWWVVFSQFTFTFLYAFALPASLIVFPIMYGTFPWQVILYMGALSYLRNLRTLSVRRPDVSRRRQLVEYVLLAPVSTLLNLYLCSGLCYFSLFTLRQVRDWGTRSMVEARLQSGLGQADASAATGGLGAPVPVAAPVRVAVPVPATAPVLVPAGLASAALLGDVPTPRATVTVERSEPARGQMTSAR